MGEQGVTHTDVMEVLRSLARSQMRFITVADLCGALKVPEAECEQLLQRFVDDGLLRATHSTNGQPYYWLTAQLAND
jgi:DNA-binding IclR family transcriptional regulator